MNIFSRYSPAIQRYIYEEGWQTLRAIQAAAGDAIFNSDANVLLSASTASGKTEAAFFPIITLMQEQPPSSIGCLYIAPLKALINDQFVEAQRHLPRMWRGRVALAWRRVAGTEEEAHAPSFGHSSDHPGES